MKRGSIVLLKSVAAGLDNHNRKQAEESDSDILNCALRKNSVIMMWMMEFSGNG